MKLRPATLAEIGWLAAADRWLRLEHWQQEVAGRPLHVAGADGARAAHARLDPLSSTVPYLASMRAQPASRGRRLSRRLVEFVEADRSVRGYAALLSSAPNDELVSGRRHAAMGCTSKGSIEYIAHGNVGELVYRQLLPGRAP